MATSPHGVIWHSPIIELSKKISKPIKFENALKPYIKKGKKENIETILNDLTEKRATVIEELKSLSENKQPYCENADAITEKINTYLSLLKGFSNQDEDSEKQSEMRTPLSSMIVFSWSDTLTSQMTTLKYTDIEASKILLLFGVEIMNEIVTSLSVSFKKEDMPKDVLLPAFHALFVSAGILQAVASEEYSSESVGPDLCEGMFPRVCADHCMVLAQEITIMRAMQGNLDAGGIASYCANTSTRYQKLREMTDNISDASEAWKKKWSAYSRFKMSYYLSLAYGYQASKRYQTEDAENCVIAIKNFGLAEAELKNTKNAISAYNKIGKTKLDPKNLKWLTDFIATGCEKATSDNDSVYFKPIPDTGDALGEGKSVVEGKAVEWKYPDTDQRWTEDAKSAFDTTITPKKQEEKKNEEEKKSEDTPENEKKDRETSKEKQKDKTKDTEKDGQDEGNKKMCTIL